GGEVLHISVHTFTPELEGEVRTADVGLLFDPAREEEADFCKRFQKSLFKQDKELQVKFNYPYLGIDDGFTTYLRQKFPKQYLGIELEVNQKFIKGNKMEKR
ncbi:N-formylglutamate amidohydrolase, partial [Salinimicrobium sp. CDJ15-91]|nr:N-formylglutamate amidohydrolase [Salinimicrobium oceani]